MLKEARCPYEPDYKLWATLLGTANAKRVATLERLEYTDLVAAGITPAARAKIMAVKELVDRQRLARLAIIDDCYQVQHPADAAVILRQLLGDNDQEKFGVLAMDTRNRVISMKLMYQCTVDTTIIRVGEVMRIPIQSNATNFIVGHNHPSGDPSPSPEDIAITRSLCTAGKLLEIRLLDHIIIGSEPRFVSLHERGLGFEY